MGNADFNVQGEWNANCDRCGFKFKSSQLRKTWDGLYVDEKCFEIRQPQDFIRGIPDKQYVPWTRPQGELRFIPNNGPIAIPINPPVNGEI